ncbi:MAG: FHA domain-containing protein [Myxococcota bacterium]|nr:FHA domain-containing protein [Myxococcota bacterium]
MDEAWSTGATSESVAAAVPAGLVLIPRDGGEGCRFVLGASTDIGRAEGEIVLAEDRYVSPRHARIVWRGGAYFIRDLESTNGIFFRIPFLRARPSSSGAGGDSLPLETTRQTSGETPPDIARLEPASEQPLADQELFLIGQQVLRFEVVKHANAAFGVASESGTLLFGTPAAPRFGRLSQRTVEGVVRDVFYLRRAETVIGRESGDVVFTDDPFVSRRHAVLRMHDATARDQGRRFTIADLGSSNGTFVQVRDEVRLRHGDQFRIGQQLFRFDHDVMVTGA